MFPYLKMREVLKAKLPEDIKNKLIVEAIEHEETVMTEEERKELWKERNNYIVKILKENRELERKEIKFKYKGKTL